jgi:hypothetical protein
MKEDIRLLHYHGILEHRMVVVLFSLPRSMTPNLSTFLSLALVLLVVMFSITVFGSVNCVRVPRSASLLILTNYT